MYQPKVSTTQKHSDSQGEHIVCKGRLVLIDKKQIGVLKVGDLCNHTNNGYCIIKNEQHLRFANSYSYMAKYPIVISETEEIEKEDIITDGEDLFEWDEELDRFLKIYSTDISKGLRTYVEFLETRETAFYKVLALPEHFSDKHLQAIVGGEMEDGDEVFVKCDTSLHDQQIPKHLLKDESYPIHLGREGCITLFPAKQSLEEAATIYADNDFEDIGFASKAAFKAGAEWAKETKY